MQFIYASIRGRNKRFSAANDNFIEDEDSEKENHVRSIPGFNGIVFATRDGEIIKNGKVLKGHLHEKGYRRVCFRANGKDKNYYVHSLVALTFIGKRPEGHHVDHIDFDKLNNSPENLRYLPAKENSVRWKRNG